MNKVSIIGGTGLIGSKLAKHLVGMGWRVYVLGRRSISQGEQGDGIEYRHCDPEKQIWPHDALSTSQVVINLAGRSIGDKRLTTGFKKEVYKSRVDVTNRLVTYLNHADNICNLLINASAIGFYGYDRGDEPLSEDAPHGTGFMAELCKAWEKESEKFEGGRCISLRTGIVLDNAGGAYKSLKTPVLLGLGSALGNGHQWVPWIHMDDMLSAIYHIINQENLNGPINMTSPNPVKNSRLIGSIANSLNKPVLMPRVPGILLKLVLGEFAHSLLGSLHVVPNKLERSNYTWKYPHIDLAVKQLNWGK
ncbi:MAG: TIGR01777 family protein [Bacteroidetes bacterium]|nr:TIGR01777 family protein [Bacteroidota bacterium]